MIFGHGLLGTVPEAMLLRQYSENHLERDLHLPGVSGGENLPGCALTDGRIGVGQIHVVERVERLPAELDIPLLAEREFLQ